MTDVDPVTGKITEELTIVVLPVNSGWDKTVTLPVKGKMTLDETIVVLPVNKG
jgi:hypothetical protein